MKVVCIKDFKSTSLQDELTYGKIYEAESRPNIDDCYFVRCDKGYISPYNKRNFITLEEYRNTQLNKILKQ
jgi:hypothetical protein